MANQQLVDYIKAQLALGVTKQDLTKAIATAGWNTADADEAFAVVEGRAPAKPMPPTPPSPSVALAKEGQPMPIQQAPVGQPAPATVQPATRPAAFQPQPSPVNPQGTAARLGVASGRGRAWPWVLGALLLVIIVLAVVWFTMPTLRDVLNFYITGGAQQYLPARQLDAEQSPAATTTVTVPTMSTSTPPVISTSTPPKPATTTAH